MIESQFILAPKPGASCRFCKAVKREQLPTDRNPVCCSCKGCACEDCFKATEKK